MLVVLLVLLVVLPVLEIWTIVQVGQTIGVWETVAALVVVSVVGTWLVKREGLGVWRRFNDQLRQGKVPANELLDGVLVGVAGILLVLPGFLGDAVGLALLLPPTRALVRSVVAWFTVRRIEAGQGAIRIVRYGVATAGAGRAHRHDGRQVVDVTEVTHRPGPGPADPLELDR